MKRFYLTHEIGNEVKNARLTKGIKSYELADVLGVSPATMSRIENSNLCYISMETVKKLEDFLGIMIYDGREHNALIHKLYELQEENRRLKELLIGKWKAEEVI